MEKKKVGIRLTDEDEDLIQKIHELSGLSPRDAIKAAIKYCAHESRGSLIEADEREFYEKHKK